MHCRTRDVTASGQLERGSTGCVAERLRRRERPYCEPARIEEDNVAGTDDQRHEAEQEHEAKKQGVPEGELIYRSVRQDGEYALQRRSVDLAWSGLAAGLSMGFSLIAEGLLRAHLPDATWTPLVAKFGYTAGFLIVILGRQQLFTEQTLTAILPLLSSDRPVGTFSNVARLWAVVLAANLAGGIIISAATAWTPAFAPEIHRAFSQIGHASMSLGFATTLVRGVYAGFLIAVMVWLLPGAGAARLWIVVLVTYLVGLGAFSHIIAGSSECFYVIFRGERTVGEYLTGYFAPTLIGNTLGGVILVAALAHAQHAPAGAK
jgi:formate/nitrite transporter FocA (FNT family)